MYLILAHVTVILLHLFLWLFGIFSPHQNGTFYKGREHKILPTFVSRAPDIVVHTCWMNDHVFQIGNRPARSDRFLTSSTSSHSACSQWGLSGRLLSDVHPSQHLSPAGPPHAPTYPPYALLCLITWFVYLDWVPPHSTSMIISATKAVHLLYMPI